MQIIGYKDGQVVSDQYDNAQQVIEVAEINAPGYAFVDAESAASDYYDEHHIVDGDADADYIKLKFEQYGDSAVESALAFLAQ